LVQRLESRIMVLENKIASAENTPNNEEKPNY